MKNLAGDKNCDVLIRQELEKADLLVLSRGKPGHSEVPFTLYGVEGGKPFDEKTVNYMERHGIDNEFANQFFSFVFTRAWYYWVVSGFVPLDIAMKIYENANGRNDVRAAGHCGAPNPCEVKDQRRICGMNVVSSYHIDTQEGLNFFVETLRKHQLI